MPKTKYFYHWERSAGTPQDSQSYHCLHFIVIDDNECCSAERARSSTQNVQHDAISTDLLCAEIAGDVEFVFGSDEKKAGSHGTVGQTATARDSGETGAWNQAAGRSADGSVTERFYSQFYIYAEMIVF